MRIRMLKEIRGRLGALMEGDLADVPDAVAEAWIAAKIAVKEIAEAVVEIEQAIVEDDDEEQAVEPKAKPRRRRRAPKR